MFDRLDELARSLRFALNQEIPRVGEVRKRLKHLAVHEIPRAEDISGVTAMVATDGGENRLVLDPIRVQIIRVVDSEGRRYFEGFIPLSFDTDQLVQHFFKNNEELQWLKSVLGLDWDAFSPSTDYLKSNLMGMLRELLEWTAILRLMSEESRPRIVLRDGLLRSVGIPFDVFDALKQALKDISVQHNHRLVGVAKRSRVLNYLSLVISVDESLPAGLAGYVEISEDLEREAAPPSYRWASPRSMGKLLLARLTPDSQPIFPVEIPEWETKQTGEIMASLSEDAAGSYPIPGYPFSLVKAHRLARIGGFEIEILERMLIKEIRERDPLLAEHVLTQMLLGRKLSMPIPDEED